MSEMIASLARFIVRVVLVVAAAVFAAALLVALLVFVSFWLLRAGWARLMGRPVAPFIMRMNPRDGFGHVFRAGQGMRSEAGPVPPEPPGRHQIADITDVEPKEPR